MPTENRVMKDPSGTGRHCYPNGKLTTYLDCFSLLHHYDENGFEYMVVDTTFLDVWRRDPVTGNLVMVYSPCPWKLDRLDS